MRNNYNNGFLCDLFEKQVSSIEFLDKALEKLFNNLPNNHQNYFIICSDHGECFGEDGLYGHGFYHPKIMEVPFSIFTI